MGVPQLTMIRYLARKFLHAVLVVFGVMTLVFIILRLLPGDPAYVLAGPIATQEEVDVVRKALGIDRPIYIQYAYFLRQIATFDFGRSIYNNNVPALDLILERMPATLELVVPALILSVILAFLIGILSALRVGTWVDGLMAGLALAGQAAPSFWIGPMMIIVFARNLGWLPTFGRGGLANLILPIVTLSLPLFAVTMRMVRSGLLETMDKDYVRTARAKGVTEKLILVRHVLRNMLIPVVTYTGLQLGHLLSGSVIVETVFAWPGVGRLMVESITNRDYTVVQVSVVVFASLFVFINMIVDMLYVVIDPRVELA